MHELYATRAVLQKALQKANQSGARRVTHVYLVVGEISSYSDGSLQFHWDEISKGTAAQGAVLHFRHVPVEAQCMSCFSKYQPKDGEIVCPSCGGVGAKILAGEEFYLEAVDVE